MKKKIAQTSIDAYKSLDPEQLADIYKKILSALAIIKQGTFEDLASAMKVDRDRVWRRLGELEKMGLIFRPGTKKKLRSGREGFIWQLTLKGAPTVQDHSRSIQSISKQYTQQRLL